MILHTMHLTKAFYNNSHIWTTIFDLNTYRHGIKWMPGWRLTRVAVLFSWMQSCSHLIRGAHKSIFCGLVASAYLWGSWFINAFRMTSRYFALSAGWHAVGAIRQSKVHSDWCVLRRWGADAVFIVACSDRALLVFGSDSWASSSDGNCGSEKELSLSSKISRPTTLLSDRTFSIFDIGFIEPLVHSFFKLRML